MFRQMLETIPGLEKADMMRAGYAIEYDAIVPTQLETKLKIYILQVKSMVHQVTKKQLDKVSWQVLMQQVMY